MLTWFKGHLTELEQERGSSSLPLVLVEAGVTAEEATRKACFSTMHNISSKESYVHAWLIDFLKSYNTDL